MKSVEPAAYYAPHGVPGAFRATSATAGPWSAEAQHGGPPAALLGRAIESVTEPGRVVGRFTMDLLGPVPVGPVSVGATVVRPGRSVALVEATLRDDAADRTVARAAAWTLPLTTDGPAQPTPPPSAPGEGTAYERTEGWGPGYIDSVEWRWLSGRLDEPGAGVAWMRPTLPLVEGEEMTGLQRLLTCVDSASGVSAALDIREWAFLNTELTVTVLRPPEGEWVCLDARTTLGPGSVGMAVSDVYDERGLVARSSQTLLVVHRP